MQLFCLAVIWDGGRALLPHLLVQLAFCYSCIFEPEGNACSLTDSTAEEHVLALVEHAADEARDRINRYLPNSKVLPLLPHGHFMQISFIYKNYIPPFCTYKGCQGG